MDNETRKNNTSYSSSDKEEMARMIARNIAMNTNKADSDIAFDYSEEIPEPAQSASVGLASRKALEQAARILDDDDLMFSSGTPLVFDDVAEDTAEPSKTVQERPKKPASRPLAEPIEKSKPRRAEKTEDTKNTRKSNKKTKKKKKSTAKIVSIICCVFLGLVVAATAALYVVGINTYKDVFLDHTYINGTDVSGKSQAEACKLVAKNSLIPEKMTVTKADGSAISVKLSDIGYVDSTKTTVEQFYSQQNHYIWFNSKFKSTEFTMEQSFSYDKKKLEKILDEKIINAASGKEPENAYIKKSDNDGYVIVNEVAGDKINAEKKSSLYEYVEQCLDDQAFVIDISDVDCYQTAEVTADMLQESCEKLNNLYDIQITFDFDYTTETLNGDTIMDWIVFDDKDEDPTRGYTVDEDKVEAYVETLAEKYDTYGKDREFKSTNRGTITVKSGEGCYGWWIDQQKTMDLIIQTIEEGTSANTKPVYYKNPDSQYEYVCNEEWRTADTDYGNTYVEIDLSAQHLWYYKNGKLEMESDIVSGYPNESRNTPEGVYKVWYKEKAKTLVGSADGQSYASYVDFWNNISTIGIGLHDASWQNGVFGGTKYQSSTWGSHGCINMPYDKAKYVYDNIEMGTPVFAYWS